MAKLPRAKPRRIIRALGRLGFYVDHQEGSHVHLRHPIRTDLRVTVPFHSSFDLPPSVVHSILKQAQVDRSAFLENL